MFGNQRCVRERVLHCFPERRSSSSGVGAESPQLIHKIKDGPAGPAFRSRALAEYERWSAIRPRYMQLRDYRAAASIDLATRRDIAAGASACPACVWGERA